MKFVLALAFILTTSLLPMGVWPIYILLLASILSAEILSELGVGYILKRAALALPFILAALPLLFTVKGTPILAFTTGKTELTIALEGVERFTSIAFKSWLSVQTAILLASTTPFPDLLVAMRAVRLPRLLVAIFGLMWRYIFVLADETLRLLRARSARSSQSDIPGIKTGRSVAWRAKITGGMAGSLFLRAFERSDRIYQAMLARGYNGEVRAIPLPKLAFSQWLILAGGLAILGLFLALSFLF